MPQKRKIITKNSNTKQKQLLQHPKKFLKVYWPYIPIIAIVLFGVVFGNITPQSKINNPSTLAYSTEMSTGSLLSGTNSQRNANGLGPLSINNKLNNSAQAKANDMAAKDYWSHNTPSGQEPWIFFDSAGYVYEKAGENLAYGFSTGNATIVGWMNSPSHRANVLDVNYTEVGFGFLNSENFVGTGQETIIVAHYGKPVGATPPPPPIAATAPTAKPQTLQANQQQIVNNSDNENQQLTQNEDTVEQEIEEVKISLSDERFNQVINTDKPVPDTTQATNITRLQQFTGGNAPWSALALSVVTLIIIIVWLLKHAVLVKRYVREGEHFVAHHPVVDVTVVAVSAAAVYLSQSSGVVL